jgi:hypothetical protein
VTTLAGGSHRKASHKRKNNLMDKAPPSPSRQICGAGNILPGRCGTLADVVQKSPTLSGFSKSMRRGQSPSATRQARTLCARRHSSTRRS